MRGCELPKVGEVTQTVSLGCTRNTILLIGCAVARSAGQAGGGAYTCGLGAISRSVIASPWRFWFAIRQPPHLSARRPITVFRVSLPLVVLNDRPERQLHTEELAQ